MKTPSRSGRRWRRAGCLLLSVLAVLGLLSGLGALLFGRTLLEGVARALVVRQEPVPADLVVVHAGEAGRVAWGLRLMQQGRADHLLVFLDPSYEKGFFGLGPEEATRLARETLLEGGLDPEDITMIREVYSTWDEGLEARAFLQAHPEMKTVLVVSNPFHMRRVRAVWEHLHEGTPDPPRVVYVPMPWEMAGVRPEGWWTRERDLMWVFTEYTKLLLYHLRYF